MFYRNWSENMAILGFSCSKSIDIFCFCGVKERIYNDILSIMYSNVFYELLTWQCWRSSPQCGTWGLGGPWRGHFSVSQCSSETPRLASPTWGESEMFLTHKCSLISHTERPVPEMSQAWKYIHPISHLASKNIICNNDIKNYFL